MKLDDLLSRDKEAAQLFDHLPLQVQKTIRRTVGDNIDSLADLRDHTIHMVDHNGPFYANAVLDGTELDPELKAHWTMEHQT